MPLRRHSNIATDPTNDFTESLRPRIARNARFTQGLRSGTWAPWYFKVPQLSRASFSDDPGLVWRRQITLQYT
ncbi:hypothetical protein MPLSOD_180012 [Mesorhizobium sp. SOD10]|nr:hypothetical protein MPLSOD_180012 [Mesorhizobium sp. SOD10]